MRIENGRCPRCNRVPIAGLNFCYKCRIRKGNLKIIIYNKLIEDGKCTKCKEPTTNGTRCKACAEIRNKRRRKKKKLNKSEKALKEEANIAQKKLYKERLKNGRCPRCNRIPVAGYHYCFKCRLVKGNENLAKYHNLIAEGKCTQCKKPTKNGTRCKSCAEKRNKLRRKKDGK